MLISMETKYGIIGSLTDKHVDIRGTKVKYL